MGKVVKKLVAEQILQFCESNMTLHNGQIEARKNRSSIDSAAIVVHKV